MGAYSDLWSAAPHALGLRDSPLREPHDEGPRGLMTPLALRLQQCATAR
jgi:hypothetical protein